MNKEELQIEIDNLIKQKEQMTISLYAISGAIQFANQLIEKINIKQKIDE